MLAPTYGIAYVYRPTRRCTLGTYDDIELTGIAAEQEDGGLRHRERTVVRSGVVVWEPRRPWTAAVGSAAEIDAHETMWTGRLDAQYALELPNDRELAISAGYVYKAVYDARPLGLTVGRCFGPRLRGADRPERDDAGDAGR